MLNIKDFNKIDNDSEQWKSRVIEDSNIYQQWSSSPKPNKICKIKKESSGGAKVDPYDI